MLTNILAILFIIIFIFIIFSAFSPMNSQKKFWIFIYKVRNIIDFVCYWFFNICGLITIFIAIIVFLTRFFKLS